MGLASLIGRPVTAEIEGKSLPQWLNDRDKAVARKVDPVDAAFAIVRQEQAMQNRVDAEEMKVRLRARQIHTFENPGPGELELQHKRNRPAARAEAALNGDHNGE